MWGDVSITTLELQEILRIFADSHLRELSLEVGETRLRVSKNSGDGQSAALPSVAAAANVPTAPVPPASSPNESAGAGVPEPSTRSYDGMARVTAPTVGVFYRRPAPDKPPYVEVGDVVAAGDPICTLEVMKMFTEVVADAAGRVVEVVVADGEAVEYGQLLVVLEPLDSP